MIADEIPPRRDLELGRVSPDAANDNDGMPKAAIDPRILVIARAIGRQIALEQLAAPEATNDNSPEDTP